MNVMGIHIKVSVNIYIVKGHLICVYFVRLALVIPVVFQVSWICDDLVLNKFNWYSIMILFHFCNGGHMNTVESI